MKKQVVSLLAGGALLAFASTAYAAEPLTDNQMDAVSAGSFALANVAALALGEAVADTYTQSNTYVQTVTVRDETTGAVISTPIVIGQAFSQAIGAGGFLFQAAAASHADSTAHW